MKNSSLMTLALAGMMMASPAAPVWAEQAHVDQTVTSLSATKAVPVTWKNFVRAESDKMFKSYVDMGAFGKFLNIPKPTPIDQQKVVRMNRDTIYSLAVFDLTTPVTITKPDTGKRFQSLQVIHQCLGAGLAGVQMSATLATILHHCELELAEPERKFPHVLRPSLSLGPDFKIRFNEWRRDPHRR